jgi:heptosyltransferase-2
MARRKVLVIQTAFLGDLLLSVPLLKRLRVQIPDVDIHLICRRGFGEFLKKSGVVDKVFEIQKKDKKSYQNAISATREHHYELLLSPHESFTTAMMVRKIKADRKIGFRRWWNWIAFDERIEKDKSLPEPLRQMSLMRPLDADLGSLLSDWSKSETHWKNKNGLQSPVPEWASPQVPPPFEFSLMKEKFHLAEKFVCLFPGSVWATKQWTESGYVELGRRLSEKFQILVMGGPDEKELAARVAGQIPQAKNLAGHCELDETLTVLARAELVVTNDSAGQHLAALAGAKTVSIFGPTVLAFGFRPWNSRAIVVERLGLDCRPCGKHGPMKCPIGTHECMKSITADEVAQACERLLQL